MSIEEREALLYNKRAEHGKTTYDVECPFCTQVWTVYIWSYAGCGKRCDCGAKLGRGKAWKKVKDVLNVKLTIQLPGVIHSACIHGEVK